MLLSSSGSTYGRTFALEPAFQHSRVFPVKAHAKPCFPGSGGYFHEAHIHPSVELLYVLQRSPAHADFFRQRIAGEAGLFPGSAYGLTYIPGQSQFSIHACNFITGTYLFASFISCACRARSSLSRASTTDSW